MNHSTWEDLISALGCGARHSGATIAHNRQASSRPVLLHCGWLVSPQRTQDRSGWNNQAWLAEEEKCEINQGVIVYGWPNAI
jgi:hypothetical protein